MRGNNNIRIWWMARPARLRNERGLAMAEYAPLLAVIALALFFSVSFFGPWVSDQLGVGGLAIEYGDYVAGECPDGSWDLTHIDDAPAKNGPDPNQNGDNYVCVKSDIGSGNGNSGQNANNKDNDVDPVDNG